MRNDVALIHAAQGHDAIGAQALGFVEFIDVDKAVGFLHNVVFAVLVAIDLEFL